MFLLLMMPDWLLPLLLLMFDSDWALSFEMPKLIAVMTQDISAVPVHRQHCGAASCDAGLTNTVVLRGTGLKDDVLVLPIRGAFRGIGRVEMVLAAIHVVQIVVGVLARANPRACHPDVLCLNGRPQTSVDFLAKGCPRLLSVSYSLRRCFALKPPNLGEC